jgi:hypothetical protein
VSVHWESQAKPETAPIVGASWLLSFAAAAVSLPVDALLRGMVAAGQGLQAILDYLGLSRMALEAHIVRLGLPMPHGRPRRRPSGRNPWSDEDVRRLIAWRLTGIHPETIGVRLGRSVGSIRSKSRRLGVPTPDRKALRRLDPFELRDPSANLWAEHHPARAVEPTAEDKCGTAAGAPSVSGAYNDIPAKPEAAEVACSAAISPEQGAFDLGCAREDAGSVHVVGARARRARPVRASKGRKQAQRELGLLQVVAGTDTSRVEVPVPATHRAVDLTGDLSWMGRMSNPQKSDIFVWTLGLLFMSGLHWREIAERIGREPGSVRSMRTRFGIPIARDRRLLTMELDTLRGKMTCVVSTSIVKRCNQSGTYFGCHRDDRACNTAPMVRRKQGLRDQRVEGRSPVFRLLSRAEIDRLPRHLIEPFANNERIVGVA